MRLVLPAVLLALAACAPPPQQASDRCAPERRTETAVTGEVKMGYASDRGFVSDQEIGFTAGVNLGGGRASGGASVSCPRAGSGQGPVRPLALGEGTRSLS